LRVSSVTNCFKRPEADGIRCATDHRKANVDPLFSRACAISRWRCRFGSVLATQFRSWRSARFAPHSAHAIANIDVRLCNWRGRPGSSQFSHPVIIHPVIVHHGWLNAVLEKGEAVRAEG
jgi:hypothetical protein